MTQRVYDLYRQLIDDEGNDQGDDLMNDRREYTVEDLQMCYEIDTEEAKDLYTLIQAEFEPGLPYLNAITPEVVKEYLEESIHSNWEGFSDPQKVALYLMIADMRRYTKYREPPKPQLTPWDKLTDEQRQYIWEGACDCIRDDVGLAATEYCESMTQEEIDTDLEDYEEEEADNDEQ